MDAEEIRGTIEQTQRIQRFWLLFRMLLLVSPSLRDELNGVVWEEAGQAVGLANVGRLLLTIVIDAETLATAQNIAKAYKRLYSLIAGGWVMLRNRKCAKTPQYAAIVAGIISTANVIGKRGISLILMFVASTKK